ALAIALAVLEPASQEVSEHGNHLVLARPVPVTERGPSVGRRVPLPRRETAVAVSHVTRGIADLAVALAEPLDEAVHLLVPPHPGREATKRGLGPVPSPREVPHVAGHLGGIGPVRLYRDGAKSLLGDELARDACPHQVELRRAVSGLAQQDHASVADAIQEPIEVDRLDVVDAHRGLAEETGHRAGSLEAP